MSNSKVSKVKNVEQLTLSSSKVRILKSINIMSNSSDPLDSPLRRLGYLHTSV
jgi:hypothetical protein